MSANFNYCEPPDIPEGMTLAEFRRDQSRPRRRPRLPRLRRIKSRRRQASSRPR
jgi:hypothetical protein